MVKSHPNVTENTGKIAFERGPILYCAEGIDNPGGKALSLIVDPEATFSTEKSEILGGIYTIQGIATQASRTLDGAIDISDPFTLTLVPYHLWNNRGPGEMTVWIATGKENTRPEPAPTIARKSEITSSARRSRSLIALNDQMTPKHSNDHSLSYHHWWPRKGTEEWVQFDFDENHEVSTVEVYWFDDGPEGGCRIPAGWEVQYREGEAWKPVMTTGPYSVTKDDWDTIRFESVTTDGLRLIVNLPEEYAAGLYEVVIR
jgi:hypothetical protein